MSANVSQTAVISVTMDERTKRAAQVLGLTSAEFLRRAVERIAREPAVIVVEGDESADVVQGERLAQMLVQLLLASPDARQALERIVRDPNLRPVVIDLLDQPLVPERRDAF
jgi:hypothetical protein